MIYPLSDSLSLSYPYACLEAVAAMEIPGISGFSESVSYCLGIYGSGGTSGTTHSIEIGGGGSCIEVTSLPSTETSIARARVTRLGCCDNPVTMSASATTFRYRSFQKEFSFSQKTAATPVKPAACVDTTLTINDEQDHANIVLADGSATTTTTISLSDDPPGTQTRYLKADFGIIPSSVTLSSDNATTTYTAGTLTEGSTTTTAATVEVFQNEADTTALDSVTVFNYRGFNFGNLSINDNDIVLPVPGATEVEASVTQTATAIQRFLTTKGSFLKDFYLSTKTKEGFYDGSGGRAGEWDPGIDTLYEPAALNNSAGNLTRGNNKWDNCTGEGENQECGTKRSASDLIARIAVNPCQNSLGSCEIPSRSVNPRMILATMQKEQSAVALQSYPTKPDRELNLIMGCSEIAGWRNFVDQIQCGAETFLKRYSETHFNGRSLEFPFFFKKSDGILHGGIRPNPIGDPVAFSVMNRATYIQYRYTNWTETEPGAGGVYLFNAIWEGYSTFNWSR